MNKTRKSEQVAAKETLDQIAQLLPAIYSSKPKRDSSKPKRTKNPVSTPPEESSVGIEDVACFLSVTATLGELLSIKCLRTHKESVKTKEVLQALINHPEAYTLITEYAYIADCVTMMEDRIREAIKMLDGITTRELAKAAGHD